MNPYKSLQQKIRERLLGSLDYSREVPDDEIHEMINQYMTEEQEISSWPISLRHKFHNEIFSSLRKLDILQELIEDSTVTEIMVNGLDSLFVERRGELIQWTSGFESEEKLGDVIQQIVSECNRVVNESSPMVDARLKDGSRVHVVMKPIALNGPIITIRRFPEKPIQMQDLIDYQAITGEVAELLKKLVQAKYNIFISGGTGAGKTTFLNVLSGFIPKQERVITIEDSAELQIQNIPNLVRLETRNNQVEGCSSISIRDLIRAALRMRPDRVVVGEVRGEEALDMLQAMNTGHDGSLSTGHANNCLDMLQRLETMVLMGIELPLVAIKKQIASGIDILVHLGRLRDKSRRVLQIVELLECAHEEIATNILYEFEERGTDDTGKVVGSLVKKADIVHREKLQGAGIQL